MRQPNELPITTGVLEQMMAGGGSRVFSVKPGPSPEARIVGVRWAANYDGSPLVVLIYDRPIDEPVLRHEHGLEQRLHDAEVEVARQAELIRQSCGCIPS